MEKQLPHALEMRIMGMRLFEHKPHKHKIKNVNDMYNQELQRMNDRIAVFLTRNVGSMWCAYIFVVLAAIGLLGILGVISPLVALLVSWASQTLIQLVLLPVIMVGQNVLNRKSELMAEEDYNINVKGEEETRQLIQHLYEQDAELVKQTAMLIDLLKHAKGINP